MHDVLMSNVIFFNATDEARDTSFYAFVDFLEFENPSTFFHVLHKILEKKYTKTLAHADLILWWGDS